MEACAEPAFQAQLLLGSVLHVAAREKVNVQMQASYILANKSCINTSMLYS